MPIPPSGGSQEKTMNEESPKTEHKLLDPDEMFAALVAKQRLDTDAASTVK